MSCWKRKSMGNKDPVEAVDLWAKAEPTTTPKVDPDPPPRDSVSELESYQAQRKTRFYGFFGAFLVLVTLASGLFAYMLR